MNRFLEKIFAKMTFDPTISLGTILEVLFLLEVAVKIIYQLGAVETKVNAMWEVFITEKKLVRK